MRGEAAAQFLAVDNEHSSTALERQPPDDVVALLIAASSTMTEHVPSSDGASTIAIPNAKPTLIAQLQARRFVSQDHR